MRVIKTLAAKNSTGIDSISTNMLQKLTPVLINPLTYIINQSLCTGIFPNRLKIAKVIPIFKKSDPYIFDNYRPISLLSSISKTFEKAVFNQVYAYFTNNDLFYNSQYGFRKLHSTEYASLKRVDRMSQYLDNGKLPITMYLDLSKTFDTINHEILLKKWNVMVLQTPLADNSIYLSMDATQRQKRWNLWYHRAPSLGPYCF